MALLFIALLNGFAAAVFFGGWSWVIDFEPDSRRAFDVAMPWLILALDVLIAGVYVQSSLLHLDKTFDNLFLIPALPFFALAAAVGLAGRPQWALPPWYRARRRSGTYRRARPIVARTFQERLRRDHVWWLIGLVPVMLFLGYGGALAGCSRASAEGTCADAIRSTTVWSLVGGALLTVVFYRLGWISTRSGVQTENAHRQKVQRLAWSTLLAPAAYALFRASPLSHEFSAYLVLDALIVVIATMTMGRAIALVSEAARATTADT
jgi:hypothetical protein